MVPKSNLPVIEACGNTLFEFCLASYERQVLDHQPPRLTSAYQPGLKVLYKLLIRDQKYGTRLLARAAGAEHGPAVRALFCLDAALRCQTSRVVCLR